MSGRKLEPTILNYFRDGEPAAVKLMFSFVKAAMKERFGAAKGKATVAAKRPRKAAPVKTNKKPEVGPTPAAA